MLQSLHIRNIALIEDLQIRFFQGLQVLSGETGAGKSIIIDAITLILGARADKGLIRSGKDKASVEAIFDISEQKEAKVILEREEIDYEGNMVSVYREISTSGKNLCRICGVIVPLALLRELSSCLINLHGQSEYQLLSDPAMHLKYLDQNGDEEHRQLIHHVQEAYNCFIDNHRAYAKLVRKNETREDRIKLVKKELEELHRADIKPGEEEQLLQERKRMENAEKINRALVSAYQKLISGEEGKGSIYDVREASRSLQSLHLTDEPIDLLSKKCEMLYYELEDLAFQVQKLIDQNEFDPEKFERLENRLEVIRKTEKKFGSTISEILQTQGRLEEEFQFLNGLEDEVQRMGTEHKRLLVEYRQAARALSTSRKAISLHFQEQMKEELKDLGMKNTEFNVSFVENEEKKPKMPTATGDDEVQFMISPNPGEPLKPLAQIASGGELSRIMLAMKTLESGINGADAMIFDEIDTGISGRIAQAVAEKLIRISRKHQVICISHLPQIASAADHQFLVKKEIREDRTVTDVMELDEQGRILEVGRILSGANGLSDETVKYAESMISAMKEQKQKAEKTCIY